MNMIKQLQIDELVKAQKAAIIFFQESHILDQTFENCPHIKNKIILDECSTVVEIDHVRNLKDCLERKNG